jgi:hypothetical protein
MKIAVFWVVTPCSLVYINYRFGGTSVKSTRFHAVTYQKTAFFKLILILHNVERHILYFLLNNIIAVQSKMMSGRRLELTGKWEMLAKF